MQLLTSSRLLAIAGAVALVAAAAPQAEAQNVTLVSRMGGKCLDAEGQGRADGTRIVGFGCTGGANQLFWFNQDGSITQNGKCLDASGGQGRDGDQIVLWTCNGGANQKWRLQGNRLVGVNGKCLDLEGGAGHWFGNQRAILWSCNGQDNQTWYRGVLKPAATVQGATVVQSGQKVTLNPVASVSKLIGGAGANAVAAGGANAVAAGGANVIAVGGGNVIAVGGGNVIAVGGGN